MAKPARGRATAASDRPPGLPAPGAVLSLLQNSPTPLAAREIARAFGLGPGAQAALRELLREIERSGRLMRAGAGRFSAAPPLPETMTVERAGSDADGIPLARPVAWPGPGEAPTFRLTGGGAADELATGTRATVRLKGRPSGEIEAEMIRPLPQSAGRVVGVFRRTRDGGVVVPADRRERTEYRVPAPHSAAIADGELVVAEALPAPRFGSPRVRIVERLGRADAPGAVSRLTIAAFEIPDEFPAAALAEAAAAKPVDAAGRADLRDLALVTIDGSDARDFDDAVWAEPDPDPANRGGWHIIVAIADVAHYVVPGGALDREAARRGNSVYFPDRVVPMLPEALSNGLCSLVPGGARACLAAELWIDAAGHKRRHRFAHAIMRSAARLTYDEVEAARAGDGARPPALAADRLAALYGAWAALDRWRRARGALALDLVEHRVVLDSDKRPVAIEPRPRLDSHRLIEEFMILANVAAAEALEAQRQRGLYRVHDAPDPEKLVALRDFLAELGIPGLALAKGERVRPELFNRVLARAAATPEAPLVNELVLRAQAQAVYSPQNIGHFGLALPRYVHFTSPIRRYADLLVHRALLAGMAGDAGGAGGDLAAVGQHVSATERRAAAAERAALDRYRAALLEGSVGAVFSGRITGIAPFGLFVTLPDSGADGLVPVSRLPADYYDHDARRHRLVGRRFGRIYALGDSAAVRLAEADPIGGRLLFRLADDAPAGPARAGPGYRRTRRPRR